MPIPFKAGDMVWTNFPFESSPDRPGPTRHAAVVIGAFEQRSAPKSIAAPIPRQGMLVGVYTSSQVRKFGDALPVGVIQVSPDRAASSGNAKPFFIDARIRAFIPFTGAYFPDIDKPEHGLIGSLDKGLWKKVIEEFQKVNERHREQIVSVGPLRP